MIATLKNSCTLNYTTLISHAYFTYFPPFIIENKPTTCNFIILYANVCTLLQLYTMCIGKIPKNDVEKITELVYSGALKNHSESSYSGRSCPHQTHAMTKR